MTERGRQLAERVVDAKGNIEQKLGRCLLVSQSYERLLKKLGIEHKVAAALDRRSCGSALRSSWPQLGGEAKNP